MPPMLSTSTSAIRPRTITVSTSSCRYSGWGTWFRTDSTCTANLISPAVIYAENTELNTQHTGSPKSSFSCKSARCYLSCGRRGQHISIDGQAMTLLQDLPDLLVEAHWYSVDSSIQPASSQPLALLLLPVQLSISWTRAHWGQDPTGGGGAAATLWWENRKILSENIQWTTLLISNLISMYFKHIAYIHHHTCQ